MAKVKRAFDPATLPSYQPLAEDELRRRRELLTGLTDEDAEPVDRFEVRTDAFTGPLDLLIYLLREGEVEVDQLPILPIVEQYLSYLLTLHQDLIDVNLAAESVAIIAQILDMKLKLKGLLNTADETEEPETAESDSPRLDLIRELMELQRLKRMTMKLAERFEEWQFRPGRPDDAAPAAANIDVHDLVIPPQQIVAAFKAIVEQVNAHVNEATIPREEVTLEEQILFVLDCAEREPQVAFHRLFDDPGHKEKIVVTFIAVLELTRQGKIVIAQSDLQGVIIFETAGRYRARLGLPEDTPETDRALAATPLVDPTAAAAAASAEASATDPAGGAASNAKRSPFGAKGDEGAPGAADLSDLFTGGEDDLDEEGQNMKQRIDAAVKIYHRVTAALDAYEKDGVILTASEAAERAGVEHVTVDKLKGERWWQKKKGDIAIGDQIALGEQLAAELGAAAPEAASDSAGEMPAAGSPATESPLGGAPAGEPRAEEPPSIPSAPAEPHSVAALAELPTQPAPPATPVAPVAAAQPAAPSAKPAAPAPPAAKPLTAIGPLRIQAPNAPRAGGLQIHLKPKPKE
ncbi:MAG: segregation/condensation protein A [Planctomycetota bacterium]